MLKNLKLHYEKNIFRLSSAHESGKWEENGKTTWERKKWDIFSSKWSYWALGFSLDQVRGRDFLFCFSFCCTGDWIQCTLGKHSTNSATPQSRMGYLKTACRWVFSKLFVAGVNRISLCRTLPNLERCVLSFSWSIPSFSSFLSYQFFDKKTNNILWPWI